MNKYLLTACYLMYAQYCTGFSILFFREIGDTSETRQIWRIRLFRERNILIPDLNGKVSLIKLLALTCTTLRLSQMLH